MDSRLFKPANVTALQGRNARARRSAGFTLIELLVVIAIIAILASLLAPAVARGKSEARRAQCISNIRQLSIGWLGYTIDCEEYPPFYDPPHDAQDFHWSSKISPYVGARWTDRVFQCPDIRHTNTMERVGMYRLLRGTYDINVLGTSGYTSEAGIGGHLTVGLDGKDKVISTKPSDLVMPSEMIAMGDVSVDPYAEQQASSWLDFVFYTQFYLGGGLIPEVVARELPALQRRHRGMFDLQFADGHIESGKADHYFKLQPEIMRRWNKDFQPHLFPGRPY